ncbi:MAG: M67 family metallopeptidase [bacterium]|nr:M67 family metallopeptidase [bacterium]
MNEAVWDQIFDHAKVDYPAECCGIVTSDGNGGFVVQRCENIQDKLHKKDPETHPRTARTAYRMDDMQVHKILSQTEQAGGNLVAFYHSHIDCDAYFSQEDRDAATFFGEPTYPGVIYPVVSVVDGDVQEKKVFQWVEGKKGFVEIRV